MRLLKPTPQQIEEMIAKFREELNNPIMQYDYRSCNSEITCEIPNLKLERKINIDYTPMAWLKMRALVDRCAKEIAWHGIVTTNEDHTVFTVQDILVYPQAVTAATVHTDEAQYEEWHQALPDEQYNNLRMQGHSHVNMATNPSGVDMEAYDSILNLIADTSWYIFVITNKPGAVWYKIFDKSKNLVYNTEDIRITVGGIELDIWYKDEYEQNIREHIPAPTPKYNWNASQYPAPKPKQSALIGFDEDFDETSLMRKYEDELSDPFFAYDGLPQKAKKVSKKGRKK